MTGRFLAAAASFVLTASAAIAQVAVPINNARVIGPIPVTATPGAGSTRDYPVLTAEPYFNLKRAGYLEEEFFVEGTATRYQTPSMANAVALSTGHPYKTRILIRRPVDPAKFNGVVMVEWNNVTSGYAGIDLHWMYSREYLTRNGYIHVGVQAQRVGVHNSPGGLKAWNPNRYGDLDLTAGGTITDDSLSYDVFSQVVKALKGAGRAQMLGDNIKPRVIMAVGQSQSASRLTSYYNSVQPLHRLVDGFLLQVSGGPFRTDMKEPVIRVLSENEIGTASTNTRQPDSAIFRGWEVAGAAHIDYNWVMHRQALAVRDGLTPPGLACQPEPASHTPLHYVFNAGYHHLTRWIVDHVAPPVGTPLLKADTAPYIVRDADGIAFGGIRQASVDAPIATNTGQQFGMTTGCPGNYGMHIPFSDAKIAQRYPTKAAYVAAVRAVVERNVQEGFLLPEDAAEVLSEAQNSAVGTGRPIPIH